MRFLIAVVLLSCVVDIVVGQDEKTANAAPQKQAVCKDAQIPADRVAVSGFMSAACSPPDTENAWDTVVPAEGTIACHPYKWTAAGNVLRFMACEEIRSDECPRRLDGTENAIVLRSPASCLHRGGAGLRFQCVNKLNLPKEDFVVGITSVDQCKDSRNDRFSGNSFIIQTRVDQHKPFSYCSPLRGVAPLDRELEWDEVILRRFHSDNCPDDKYVNYEKGLNAITIARLTETPDPQVTLCIESPIVRPRGMAETDKKFFYADDRKLYVWDDLCGGKKLESSWHNGVRIKPPADSSQMDPWGH